MEYYKKVIREYAVFEGRAHRREYWMFVLVNLLIIIALGIVEGIIGLDDVLTSLYCLAVIIPSVAVAVRRLHDTSRSGWWLLLSLIPIVGTIIVIVFLATDSVPGTNEYGPNPKESKITDVPVSPTTPPTV